MPPFNIGKYEAVLVQVLEHLRRPPPPPNSGATSCDIRQYDLAACMRVSSTFNRAAGPMLYRHVITDNPLALVYGLGKPPSAPDVSSKTALLGLTRHLSLEYPTAHLPATYTEILAQVTNEDEPHLRLWRLIEASESEQEAQDVTTIGDRQLHKYLVTLSEAVNGLMQWSREQVVAEATCADARDPQCEQSPFRLTSLSTCAYLDGHSGRWTRFPIPMWGYPEDEHLQQLASMVLDTARRYFRSAFLSNTGVKHVCCRTNAGPLSLDGGEVFRSDHPSIEHAVHHSSEYIGMPCIFPGAASVVIKHQRPFADFRRSFQWEDDHHFISTSHIHKIRIFGFASDGTLQYADDCAHHDLPCEQFLYLPNRFVDYYERIAPHGTARHTSTPQAEGGQTVRLFLGTDVMSDPSGFGVEPISREVQASIIGRQSEELAKRMAKMGYDFELGISHDAPPCVVCGV